MTNKQKEELIDRLMGANGEVEFHYQLLCLLERIADSLEKRNK